MASYLHGLVLLAIRMASIAVLGSDVCPSLSSVQCPCPRDWQFWQRACYRLIPGPAVTWPEAWAACKEMGGVMAAPRSIEENQFVFQMAPKSINVIWVGCKRGINDEAKWKCEGQARARRSMYWHRGQPNNLGGSQDCVVSRHTDDGMWGDGPCDKNRIAVCVRRDVGTPCPTNAPRYCFTNQTGSACLPGRVSRGFVTGTVVACGSACIAEPTCRSFNVKQINHGKKLCQLIDDCSPANNVTVAQNSTDCLITGVCFK